MFHVEHPRHGIWWPGRPVESQPTHSVGRCFTWNILPERLDLVAAAGEYECLEARRTDETIMRGRRRGRTRPSSQETPDPATDVGSGPVSTGSVTLIETPPSSTPPPSDATPPPPGAAPTAPSPEPSTTGAGGFDGLPAPKRIKETISDVATAHAELDHVLPPNAGSPGSSPAARRPERPGQTADGERLGDTPVDPGVAAVAAARPPPAAG